ncbi:MAG: alpha/beta hydrolase [Vulcanimicrobiaceae bacterium]
MHVAGPPDGAPILFLHGVGGAAWSWEPQRDALGERHRTFVWEARGHGAAAPVGDAGLGDYYADALEALDAVVATAGAPWIVGHSMGGLLALALAAERGPDVRGLVLVDPVYAPDGGTHLQGRSGRIARRLMAPFVASMMRDGRLARTLARMVFAASFVDRDCMTRAWARQRTQVPVEYPKMMYEAFDGPTNFPNRAFAREIDVPTLLLEPAASARPRFPKLVAELERLGDRFNYLVLDGGHYLQLDRSAARLSASVARFVARW